MMAAAHRTLPQSGHAPRRNLARIAWPVLLSLIAACGGPPPNTGTDALDRPGMVGTEQTSDGQGTPQTQDPGESGRTLDDRLGASDGFTAALFFVSDLTGSLDVCGCAQNPQGGVARLKGFLNEFERRYPGVPYITLDLGHSLSERVRFGTNELFESVKVGNQWVIRAYDAMRMSAVNVSFRDLLHLRHTFDTGVYEDAKKEFPILERFVSANVLARDESKVSPKRYVIESLSGGRMKRPLRIGVVGLTEKGSIPVDDFTILDPLDAADRIVPEVRRNSDMVVVMGYLSRPVAQRLATSRLPWDALLTAYRFPQVQPVRRFGKKLWATSIYEGRFLGELRVYTDDRGRVSELSMRYIPLDDVVPDDLHMALMRDEAREAMKVAESRSGGP